MGAKIEFCFLVKESNRTILEICSKVLESQEWTYNNHIPGEYTVWLDGPLWMLGESRTIKENEQRADSDTLSSIFMELANGFSPSVVLGTTWFGKPLHAVLLIVEGEGTWRQLTFSVDWHEAFGRLTEKEKEDAAEQLKTLFIEFARYTKAYYGLGGIELPEIADEPDSLDESSMFADIMFFSRTIIETRTTFINSQEYFIRVESGGAMLAFLKKGFLELG